MCGDGFVLPSVPTSSETVCADELINQEGGEDISPLTISTVTFDDANLHIGAMNDPDVSNPEVLERSTGRRQFSAKYKANDLRRQIRLFSNSHCRRAKGISLRDIAKESVITEKVAIIVIAFNEERRISPCLTALLNQDTAVEYTVIVVDDGSHDSTAEIVHQLRIKYPNLRLLRHEVNRGRGAARRTGQDATDSPWIGFVDADIVVPPNWLERCLQELSEVDGVSGIAQPDGDCAVIWRICKPSIRQRPGSAEITGNNVLFSRDVLKTVPFSPNAKLGEDFRLAKLMIRAGYRLRTVEGLTVEHRETKTYMRAVWWMWQSGVDATSLLFEFRIFRMPDFAWLAWLSVLLLTALAAGLGFLGLVLSIVAIVAMTIVVNALYIWSRFNQRPYVMRFLVAQLISPPMMLAYLVGRTAGLIRIPYLQLHKSVITIAE